MEHLITALVVSHPTAVTPIRDVVKAAKQRIPTIRRDEILIALANAGHALLVTDGVTYISGAKLKGQVH